MHKPLTPQVRSTGFSDAALPETIRESADGELPPQRILYVTSEIADYVKSGGLGEVSAALPRTLRQEYDVRVLIPGYRQVLNSAGDISVVARHPGHARL